VDYSAVAVAVCIVFVKVVVTVMGCILEGGLCVPGVVCSLRVALIVVVCGLRLAMTVLVSV